MSKYAVGDRVYLEAEIRQVDIEPYGVPYNVKFLNGATMWTDESNIFSISKTYEDGLNDAWELARNIYKMSRNSLLDVFGACNINTLFKRTPQELVEKLKAYKESKAIKKGNIVLNVGEDVKAIIMDDAIAAGAWQVYTENGCVELWKECEFKKTGKTVDIEHLLEQIRGNE